ncbi:hypothetical protein [Frigoriflavimonas asaccharolytica]|uniref:Lipoprotein n=1 Tax=Frigoriflavimonas asaccharolytica TaxID=2735899 RepID=A0A8J8GA41_9FLAO|nr:hypothetical protein [Frigoriflavimonas asaccharolytica]NRS92757.1 hypothetical protein [Frigoriflavimonas asaccharolytica]
MKKLTLISTLIILSLTSCNSRFIENVEAGKKTKFGFEVTAPNKTVYFVENEKINTSQIESIKFKNTTNKLYNNYGPATDIFYIGRTNAKDLKFNLNDKTYYLEISKLPKRNAMVLFDGKHKPKIVFKSKKFEKLIKKIK